MMRRDRKRKSGQTILKVAVREALRARYPLFTLTPHFLWPHLFTDY